ncbi:MAG: hypothetical protein J0L99_13170 [Chitinophagales bacterium]|nr:hypothetical protein [Chitinophagales bacterium]
MKEIITFFLFLLCIGVSAQSITQSVPLVKPTGNDIYGLRVKVDSVLMSDRCACEYNQRLKFQCRLYRITTDTVLYLIDTAVYKTKASLSRVRFVVMAEHDGILQQGNRYTLLCRNSNTPDYLLANRALPFEEHIGDGWWGVYPTGLVIAKDFTFFQRILLALKINRRRIYQKAPDRPYAANRFWRAIQAYEAGRQ